MTRVLGQKKTDATLEFTQVDDIINNVQEVIEAEMLAHKNLYVTVVPEFFWIVDQWT